MCYMIITGGSLIWFLLSLIADMCVISAIVTPKWLIGPSAQAFTVTTPHLPLTGAQHNETIAVTTTTTTLRYPSVGIYTRCKAIQNIRHSQYHCGAFDLDGFATDSEIYPSTWKAAMFFISLGFVILTLTVLCTLISCCRQSMFGKSIHNMTACAQVTAGISVMLSLFLHPLGWSATRVQLLCGADAEPFYAAGCSLGISFYSAIAGVVLCFVCAGISLKAESSNMRSRVKRRVEEGDRLVCIP
ncbi:LHFPL tetraspan subfamily member 2a protein [Stomoxys calcitrans]|uniref:Lipoma HMGIC fusion partner-like 2 protein n=1 Tax=Stomoxys calcitrans TaxID=35570 RepID=A0A1I8Q232_STOCA|nr:LHFPL tetraspan subfamily member 2a protein [Stomoxys calcitrans]XP_013119104.1 LHFPL tetraspan subfamily member 2a protein [Stomoxys calcitrans]XP_013119105.1 LHFPL tetraspan subfamily member 2a protein [Stomoxys calcitrans]XP_013119106.1 LHFPL tetraspan subfamily member 2a protein [Stomoxys calcitrans]XP_013119107.1 LHFPL tetraspan subfamily member 2a protein [Stomoxys calcitrans]XP_013119109.1 LHFPL tetraspan subfamily member 2a protein [Stomoxys calcitrans]